MKSKAYLLTCFIFIILNKVNGQSNCTKYYYGEKVTSFTEDSTFLWIGTNNNGLIKFNKLSEIKTYYNTSNSNINSNYILDLIHYNNELIISTDSNLLVYNDGSFNVYNDTINGLLIEDSSGNLIIADNRGANHNKLYYLNGANVLRVRTLQESIGGLGSTNIDITIDNLGTIWIIRNEFYNSDVIKIDSNSQTVFNLAPNNPSGTSIASFENSIWAAFNYGVYNSIQSNWQLEHQTLLPDGTINNGLDTMKQFISAMQFDKDGVLWCGTLPTGFQDKEIEILYKYNGDWFFIPQIDLQNTSTSEIFVSEYTDNIYFGTSEGFIKVHKTCLGVGIYETPYSTKVMIYPNPADNMINIKIEKDQIKLISLNNLEGKTLKTYHNKFDSIDVSELPSGLYLLNILTNKGVICKKITLANNGYK